MVNSQGSELTISSFPQRAHLIGIGGSGMAALAEYLISAGHDVSGSDLKPSEITRRLASQGATIYDRHSSNNLRGAQFVVISDAIPPTNIEVREARLRALPILGRAEFMKHLGDGKLSVMVSGSHGKSTTAGMIAWVLDFAGCEPSFAIGADVLALEKARGRNSSGDHFVAEACEAFQNLARYAPGVAFINNIDDDHIAHYGSRDRLDEAFAAFANRATRAVVVNGDDPGVNRALPRIERPVTTFGFDCAHTISASEPVLNVAGSTMQVAANGSDVGELKLYLPGRHIASNALGCVAVATQLGIPFPMIAEALAHFTGMRRRWQRYETGGRFHLFEDYAHHPTEIATVRQTARLVIGSDHRIAIAFQPQLYSRTLALFEDFARELSQFDDVFLVEIDGSGERNSGNVSSSRLAEAIRQRGGRATFFSDLDHLVDDAPALLSNGDCLIVAGAGSIGAITQKIADAARTSTSSYFKDRRPLPADFHWSRDAGLKIGSPAKKRTEDSPIAILSRRIALQPDAPAVSDATASLSYSELDRISTQYANALGAKGIVHGDVVGVRLRSSIDLIVLIVAIAKCGAVYLPLDPTTPAQRGEFMLSKAKATLLITDEKALYKSDQWRTLGIDELRDESLPPGAHTLAERDAIDGNVNCYICFTSGSTGEPKGVPIRNRSLASFLVSIQHVFNIGLGSRVALNTSIGFDVSLGEIWTTLCGGGELRATNSSRPLFGERLQQFLNSQAITHFAVTPTVLNTIAEPLPHLHTIISVGEACPQATVDRWATGRNFLNAYGPTEATIFATVARCEATADVTIGHPLSNTTAFVIGEDNASVPAGNVGELLLGGEGVASGYLDLKQETNERFVHLPLLHTGLLYRTGDLVRLNDDGSFSYLGRLDDQVKLNGIRVELQEIEQTIMRNPAFIDAAVCVDERENKKTLVCFAKIREADFDWDSVVNELARWLPSHMIPSACVPVAQIKRTASGKKDRKSLLQEFQRGKVGHRDYIGPETDIQRRIAEIWKEVLESPLDVSVDDNFFWIGGDSLRVLDMITRVEEKFDVRSPAGFFGSITTIRRMAVQIIELLNNPAVAEKRPDTDFKSSRVYKQLRDLTASWKGKRFDSAALIVSATMHATAEPSESADVFAGPVYDFFVCVQTEEELHALADLLGPSFRVHAMRSGHLVMDYSRELTDAVCEHYISEILAMKPTGQLLIGGICQGGIIAAEIGQQLWARGHQIHLLVLFEQSQLVAYKGEIAFFYSEDSYLNPNRRFASALARYDELYGDNFTLDIIPGSHGSIHRLPQGAIVADKLRQRAANVRTTTAYPV